MSLCFVSLYMNSECNKLTYSRTVEVKCLESFERDELELILWISMQPCVTTMNKLYLEDFHLCRKLVLIRSKPIKMLLKVCSINTVYEV